jgi:hypothetical protein
MRRYDFYLGGIHLPVTPGRLEIKHSDRQTRLDLACGNEVIFPKSAGLIEIGFTALLPEVRYPFAVYKAGNFVPGWDILSRIMALRETGEPFRFIVVRQTERGRVLSPTNIRVKFSQIVLREDASEGTDVFVDIKLIEHRNYSARRIRW